MASSVFATTAIAHPHKRKRDFADGSDSGVMEPGRTMKRWRNGRPREEEVYQYTLSKLFSAQSQSQPSAAPQFAHPRPQSASPQVPKNAPTRVQQQPRNAFAAMAHTKPSASAGVFKFMCLGGNGVAEVVVACEDCDRRIELTGFAGEDEGRCVGCARRVCDVGCSIARGDGSRVCLECAMKG